MNIRKSYVVLAGLTCILCLSSSWFTLLKNNAKVDNGTATSRIKTSLRAQLNVLGEGRGQKTSSSLSYYNEEELAKQIPSCAEHVFLTLHKQTDDQQQWQESDQHRNEKEEDAEENNSSCKGMLVRDDIILTTHECSQSRFTFRTSSGLLLEATPHTTLNANMHLHSNLGFLQAKDAPYHYMFLNRPVRRARMFLSLRTNPITSSSLVDDDEYAAESGGGGGGGASGTSSSIHSQFISCEGYRPIAHNFPLQNGDMIPIGEELLTVSLPENGILWEHLHLATAPGFKNEENERWWTKPITLQKAKQYFQQYFDHPKIKGPDGSISPIRAHSSFEGKASSLCEMLDPSGHRRDVCFYNYITRWIQQQQPFSGQNFFDWLDYGTGATLFERNMKFDFLPDLGYYNQRTDEDCLKKSFNSKKVHYFNNTEREDWEVILSPSEDGQDVIARYKKSKKVVSQSSFDNPHLYMFDLNKRLYIIDNDTWDRKKYGTIKHTAILAGGPALSAGETWMKKNGAIWGVNYSSGHYRPQIEAVTMMYKWIEDQNLNTTAFYWVGRSTWNTEECHNTDWRGLGALGFNGRLEKTCVEVTKSPKWVLKTD